MYEDKVKSSRASLRETRDKRPLDRDPDRSWCHGHSSVKLFWSAAYECAAAQSNGRLSRVSRRL